MSKTIDLIIVGCGNRGSTYACLAAARGARVVAVVDPSPVRRNRLGTDLSVEMERRFADWADVVALRLDADLVVVATPDQEHLAPSVAFLDRGYPVLLEKPIAPTEAEATMIVDAAQRSGAPLVVCHVMRYQPMTKTIKSLVDDGELGDVVAIQMIEPIGADHFAHSFVRGNWRKESESSSMLLSKSCHDLDWLSYIIGSDAELVSSFGGLYEFRPERAPDGSTDRCVDCQVEQSCPYSAVEIYLGRVRDGHDLSEWPVNVITDDHSNLGVRTALETGPYGRCVYRCDNDVVDHQVVNIRYRSGAVASFTVGAFTPREHRKARILGTHGYIETDWTAVTLHRLRGDKTATIEHPSGARGPHAGGDEGLVEAVLEAIRRGDWERLTSDGRESLRTHRVVWAAETARKSGTMIRLE